MHDVVIVDRPFVHGIRQWGVLLEIEASENARFRPSVLKTALGARVDSRSVRALQGQPMAAHAANTPARHTGHETVVRDVLRDHSPGADERVAADRDATHDLAVAPIEALRRTSGFS